MPLQILEAVARRCSVKKVFFKISQFTRKHLCQSLFFNKVAGLRPAILLKNRLWHGCFSVNFAKFLETPFYSTPMAVAPGLNMRNPENSSGSFLGSRKL